MEQRSKAELERLVLEKVAEAAGQARVPLAVTVVGGTAPGAWDAAFVVRPGGEALLPAARTVVAELRERYRLGLQ